MRPACWAAPCRPTLAPTRRRERARPNRSTENPSSTVSHHHGVKNVMGDLGLRARCSVF
jgi:hypothetical protein